ncbi:hypothetical protein [uncultured Anaeromusa sp.]|uniref:hypothetical protein n=1 Tax=uncultured Anaeromusa sp. TaxID=673273 RepID=UPI0029C62259|nr:hypothetical protein [uncultured Anaeromusa sp.]
MTTPLHSLDGTDGENIEQESRESRRVRLRVTEFTTPPMRLTVRDVPNAGDAKDGIIVGLF